MRDHVRILAYLHIVLGSLGVIAALVVLLVFGGIAGIVGAANPHDPGAWHIAIPVLGIVGAAICGLVLLLSIPGIITGIGLLKLRPWARILGIVLSALNLLHVPLGTALGIYGLWVLLKPETERLFCYPVQPQAR
jgi:hypothetical protein